MALLDKKTAGDATRLLIFIVITTMATGLLVILIGNLSFQGTNDYEAEFVDVAGVVEGDDVRIAGVKVGSVKAIEAVNPEGGDTNDTRAVVTFSVFESASLTKATSASIRFRNLVGQRYISLAEGVGDSSTLKPGETIPISQTSPALDLTMLFNGFKPLFEALSPDDLNKLSYEVIQVFQGEGGTLKSLLQSTASVTSTLANRDALISELLDNLDFVLDRVADRETQLSALIKNFRTLVGGLNEDRDVILGSLDEISRLSVETADLVDGIRPPFVEDIKQLRRLTTNINRNKAELDRALQVLPIKLRKVGRTAIYGSFFNFFLCDFQGKVKLPGNVNIPLKYETNSDRCDLG